MITLSGAASVSAPARAARSRGWRPWLIAWLGGPVVGIANGVARELTYKDRVGDLRAHQISTVTLIGLFAGYFWLLHRRRPIATTRTALGIGAVWAALTVAFEFGFGHYVDRKSWSALLADYNLAKGRLWPLVLVSLGLGPAAVRALQAQAAA